MKKSMVQVMIAVVVVFGMILPSLVLASGLDGFLKNIQDVVGGGQEKGLSNSTIVDGLKEALEIGTDNAVGAVSRLDGYYGNPDIKILLPEQVQRVEGLLRGVGYGETIDAFEQSMNRAAEKAAPEAKQYFVSAIKEMSFEDAQKILKGGDNAATLYFEEKTRGSLLERFKPIVDQSMSEVGVTRYYQDLAGKVKTIPFAGALSFDLNDYVTNKSLDGLFTMVASEEAKIRHNPSARVTDLLKTVFGK